MWEGKRGRRRWVRWHVPRFLFEALHVQERALIDFGWAGGVWLLLAWLEDQPESLILAQDERWRQA
jgi:hypothetical protein